MKRIKKRNQVCLWYPPTPLSGPCAPSLATSWPLFFQNPSTSLGPTLPGVSFSWLQRHLFVIDFIFKIIFFFPFPQPYWPLHLPTLSQSKLLPLYVFAPAISLLFCLDRTCFLAFWCSTWRGSNVNLLWSHYLPCSQLFFSVSALEALYT